MEEAGYTAITAVNGNEALSILDTTNCDLVLLDLRMPDMDGLAFLTALQERIRATGTSPLGVVMITGCDDLSLVVRAMRLGALDYILKPFDPESLDRIVVDALKVQKERIAVWQQEQTLRTLLQSQSREISDLFSRLKELSEAGLQALVAALDVREKETNNHSQRVSGYARHLAFTMHLGERECEVIRRAALLHDVGKIGVPDQILLKPGPLTQEELREIQKHPIQGHVILQKITSLREEAEIVLAHHERYDGAGYPRGLRGAEIPLGARIFAVIDSFDAITSDRPYRPSSSYEEAAAEIVRGSGTQFDPEIVSLFLAVPAATWREIRDKVNRLK